MSEIPPIAELLQRRTGEEMALNDRYLNPQMGRILRTLGFDRTWVGGDRTHLIDADGDRYLDLISGYGVFALGRNHPDVIQGVREVLDAGTANLPQLGVTLLSGVLAEQLLARAPGSVAAMVPANIGHRGRRGGDQDRARCHRSPAVAVRRARISRSHARLAVAQRQSTSSARALDRCCRIASRSRSASLKRSNASSGAATSPR